MCFRRLLVGRGHFRGQHAAFLRTRSRAEWLTAAFEVPSFPASNHWEAGWMERQRGGGTEGERERERGLLEYLSVAGFAARQRPHPGEVATVQLMRAGR